MSSSNLSLAHKWDQYLALVMPPNASPVQRLETRRAFYAGAQALFQLMTSDAVMAANDDDGARFMETINQELQEFGRRIQQGKA